jgi:hypothetical protein
VVNNSKAFLTQVVYFSEGSPDLLQITSVRARQDKRSIKLLRNKVYYNLLQAKKALLNGELPSEKQEDWKQTVLYTVHGDFLLIDMIATDINFDNIQDVIAVMKRNDGQTFLLEVVFTDAAHTNFYSSELAFENQGIKQVLGVLDVNKDGKNDFVYLSSLNQLAYVANQDPVYTSQVIWGDPLDISSRLKSYFIIDFNQDGLTDFVLPVSGDLVLIKQVTTDKWEKHALKTSQIKDVALAKLRTDYLDFILLLNSQVAVLSQTEVNKQGESDYVWTAADGKVYGFALTLLDLNSEVVWSRLLAADLVGDGNLDLVLYSNTQRMIGWGRRAVQVSDFGWNPNFWMLLMIYVMVMSLILGLAHTAYLKKLKHADLNLLHLPAGIEFKAAPAVQDSDERFKVKRKITV